MEKRCIDLIVSHVRVLPEPVCRGRAGPVRPRQALPCPALHHVAGVGERLVTLPHTTWMLDVAGLPDRAGIDPYNRLIDRVPNDNIMAVTAAH